jgi:hypothetical protein
MPIKVYPAVERDGLLNAHGWRISDSLPDQALDGVVLAFEGSDYVVEEVDQKAAFVARHWLSVMARHPRYPGRRPSIQCRAYDSLP